MRNFWLLIVLSFNLVADGSDEHKKSKCYDIVENEPIDPIVRYVSPDGNDDVDNDCTDRHNPCKTIQKALDEASPGNVIELLEGIFFEPAEVVIPIEKSPIFIFGQDAKKSIIDGNDEHRLFNVQSEVIAVLCGLTIRNGRDDSALGGGAILNNGALDIFNSILFHNKATDEGGAISNFSGTIEINDSTLEKNSSKTDGGAIANRNTLVIIDSTINENRAENDGGAILNVDDTFIINSTLCDNRAERGGAIFNSPESSMDISDSTLSNNKSKENGGAIFNASSLTIDESTFSNNKAQEDGGAIYNEISFSTVPISLTITESTFSDNKANGDGGAIFNEVGAVNLINSTISANKAYGSGGAIINFSATNIRNSTITRNFASDAAVVNLVGLLMVYSSIIGDQLTDTNDCSGTITDDDFNLDSDGTCNWTDPNSFTADPKLEPLDNYGGPTETHRPSADSPTINASALGNCEVSTDQRGFPRPSPPGGRCDIGSVEIQQ